MNRAPAFPVQPPGRPRELAADPSRDAARAVAHAAQDLLLAERVERAMGQTGYLALRAVDVAVRDGLVRLHGRVASYYLKQLAQEAALAVADVGELRNEIEVTRDS